MRVAYSARTEKKKVIKIKDKWLLYVKFLYVSKITQHPAADSQSNHSRPWKQPQHDSHDPVIEMGRPLVVVQEQHFVGEEEEREGRAGQRHHDRQPGREGHRKEQKQQQLRSVRSGAEHGADLHHVQFVLATHLTAERVEVIRMDVEIVIKWWYDNEGRS